MVSEKSFTLPVVSSTTPFFAVLAIMFGQDCLRIYAFIISDPLTRFRKWEFTNFRKEGCSSLAAGLSPRLSGFFSIENPSFGMFTTLKIGKDLILHKKMVRKLKMFTLSHRKAIVLEI